MSKSGGFAIRHSVLDFLFLILPVYWFVWTNLPDDFSKHRRANQLLSHSKPVFGPLTIDHRNSIYKHFFTNTKQLTLMHVHDFICYVKKYISCFFPIENSEWPKNWSWLKNWFSLLPIFVTLILNMKRV